MADLIESANIILAEAGHPNLIIQLSYTYADCFKTNIYGDISVTRYNLMDEVVAVFKLVDSTTNEVVAENSEWVYFLRDISEEYGKKFMRETGLNKLLFDYGKSEND